VTSADPADDRGEPLQQFWLVDGDEFLGVGTVLNSDSSVSPTKPGRAVVVRVEGAPVWPGSSSPRARGGTVETAAMTRSTSRKPNPAASPSSARSPAAGQRLLLVVAERVVTWMEAASESSSRTWRTMVLLLTAAVAAAIVLTALAFALDAGAGGVLRVLAG
jgi:hypothetical protein